VPKQVFEKSMYKYMMDPEKRSIFEEEMQKLKNSIRTRELETLTPE